MRGQINRGKKKPRALSRRERAKKVKERERNKLYITSGYRSTFHIHIEREQL